MASDSVPATARHTRSAWEADTPWAVMVSILAPIASLKLTVALFMMSIFLVFVGTLAQVDQNMWEIINNYFHSALVWIPLQVFLPKTWFPNHQSVPGQFPYPGGLAIGSVLFLNLLAAHGVRFKPQAKSTRLAAGLLVLTLGIALTWLVIVSGHSGEGLQNQPPISWQAMWLCVKLGVVVLAVCLTLGCFATLKRTPDRSVEIVAFGISAIVTVALSLWLFISGWYINDSGMRILWQLIKCGAAAAVLLAACRLIFKKRGGIVLIHSGIALLMVGELLTSFAVEQRIAIDEGETTAHAIDIRSTELAIVDSSKPDTDEVVVVPLWVKGRKSSFLTAGETIEHEKLPFDIEVLDYYRNSDLKDVGPGTKNKATAGKGLRTIAQEVRTGSGADSSGEVDMASVYVRFLKKGTSNEIGTYMVSQVVLRGRGGAMFSFDDTVPADGKDYHVEVRFKRTYKPYSLRLIDVRKDDYIGTTTPRNYSSDVRLVDSSRNVDREVKIWMNNPLRYAGETFYQSGYHADPSGVESTTLQVVKNTGWMIPYASCMFVMFGLFAHFSGTLLRFLNRVANNSTSGESVADQPVDAQVAMAPQSPKKSKVPKRKRGDVAEPVEAFAAPRSLQSAGKTATIIFTVLVLLVFGAYLASKARPAKVKPSEMDVVGFGKLPLVYEGRVKPFDTLARNSLRVMSTKETVKDSMGNKQPAIVWLLDVIADTKDGMRHQVFKIDNLELLGTLKVKRRKGGLYSMDEIEPQMEEFRKQVRLATAVAPDDLSIYQRKVLELDTKLQLFFKLREAFRIPEKGLSSDEEAYYLAMLANVSQELANAPVPYAVPVADNEQKPWEPLIAAVTRLWAKDMAAKYEVSSSKELGAKLADQIYRAQADARIVAYIKDLSKADVPPNELDAYAVEMLAKMPPEQRASLTNGIRSEFASEESQVAEAIAGRLDLALGDGGLAAAENSVARSMWDMLKFYKDSDEHAFSRALESYHGAIAANSPESLNIGKTNFEAAFNNFAPFYNCSALYVFAFVLTTLGWLAWPFGWNRPFNTAAFGLIALTFAVHSLALLGRIYISGRPPVTNLYSSAIFIGWALVILGLGLEFLFRLGIGNVVSTVAGFSTLVIAHQLAGDGDTFTVLQAVLDTQFWLATHVVSITLGYATTFGAGLLGILFVIAGIATPVLSERVGQWTVRKILANMIYGIVCFALFFSFVGTVLGGLWADDSWGRFWGWDPKENGALIIVLWNALILHARWGGMVRDRGMALLAIGGNMVTAWSWFGVNELGVGLHSYGFTEGVIPTLVTFWGSQAAIIAVGLLPTTLWWSYKAEEKLKKIKPLQAQVAT